MPWKPIFELSKPPTYRILPCVAMRFNSNVKFGVIGHEKDPKEVDISDYKTLIQQIDQN